MMIVEPLSFASRRRAIRWSPLVICLLSSTDEALGVVNAFARALRQMEPTTNQQAYLTALRDGSVRLVV